MCPNWDSTSLRASLVGACLIALVTAGWHGSPVSQVAVPCTALAMATMISTRSFEAFARSPRSLYGFIGMCHAALALVAFVQLCVYVERLSGNSVIHHLGARLTLVQRVLAAFCLFSLPLLRDSSRGFQPVIWRLLATLATAALAFVAAQAASGSAVLASGTGACGTRASGVVLALTCLHGATQAMVLAKKRQYATSTGVMIVAGSGMAAAGALFFVGRSTVGTFFGDLTYFSSCLLTYSAVLRRALRAEERAFRDALDDSLRDRRYLMRQLFAEREDTRQRIALQLHDEIGQCLTMLISTLSPDRPARDSVRETLAETRRLAVDALDATRRIARELRPTALDDLGLGATMRGYVADYQRAHGIEGNLQILGPADARFAPETELVVYHSVVEALTNVARHSSANHFGVILDLRGPTLVAQIEDDGCGFDVATARHGTGLGLTGIAGRAELVGGTMKLESEPGKGTTIVVRIPVGM